MFGRLRSLFGRGIATVGELLGLPEMGISEAVAASPVQTRPFIVTPYGGYKRQQLLSPVVSPSRQVQGTTRRQTQRTTGVTAGTISSPGEEMTRRAEEQLPLEEAPAGPPAFDFESLIAGPLEALRQAEEAAKGVEAASLAEIEQERTRAIRRAERERAAGERQLAARERKVKRAATSAIAEARRGFAELSRGLMARFGTGISTGLGAQAILGAQTLRNIANVRARLQEAIADIEATRQGIVEITNEAIREAEAQANTLKQRARAALQQALADIGAKRGELLSRKQELVLQAVQNYRDTIAAINARNARFQQELFLQRDRARLALEEALQRAQLRLQGLQATLFRITASDLPRLTEAGIISRAEARRMIPEEILGTEITEVVPEEEEKETEAILREAGF